MTAALSNSASTSPRCGGSSPTPRSATAVSGASPPVSWTAWRRCRSPPTATASATTTACSARSSATAGSRRRPRTGSPRQPLGIRAPGGATTRSASAAGSRRSPTTKGDTRHVWHPGETVEAVGYDTPIVGWRGRHVNTLRLWSARARRSAEARRLQRRRLHRRAVRSVRAEAISKVLYPSDATPAGPGTAAAAGIFLRLRLAARPRAPPCQADRDIRTLGDHVAVQLNDTHPADRRRRADAHSGRPQRGRRGTEAWAITQATFSYTNHTLLPEALESWPVPLMERLLPRHMQIIYLINADASRRGAPARLRRAGAVARSR